MKAFLMYADRDFDLEQELPLNAQALTEDLGLDGLFGAMAADDKFLFEVAKHAVLSSLTKLESITYRQRILADCLAYPSVVRELYAIAVETFEGQKHLYGALFFGRTPDSILYRSVELLQFFVGMLKRLRAVAEEHAGQFRSEGFSTFFQMLTTELSDEYFAVIESHLDQLRFKRGVLVSAELGGGNRAINYVLRTPAAPKGSWIQQIVGTTRPPSYTFRIPDRDEAGANALSELRGRGVNLVADALAQSTDHILSFFDLLRCELGFFVGCLNLHARLTLKGEPICFSDPLPLGQTTLSYRGLYDACLSLSIEAHVVGNDIEADRKSLLMITGANQGGKSTLLRSIGQAQLMMQCGMFTPAESFRTDVCSGVFTHFKREEDATMTSGKLDEELSRMSDLADAIATNGVVLFNESFAATNEREGSEIARQIVQALLESGVKVFFVTHFFDLAYGFYSRAIDSALFLRADRRADGRRTFKVIEGEPLPTSYGVDLYERVFAATPLSTASTGSSEVANDEGAA